VEGEPLAFYAERQVPIAVVSLGRKKGLDISLKKLYPLLDSHTSSDPVNFQHNCNLLETAMKKCLPKGSKVKPPRDIGSLLEAFSFGRTLIVNDVELDLIQSYFQGARGQ